MKDKSIRIIIAGSRTFNNYNYMKRKLSSYIGLLMKTYQNAEFEIISGGAKGADNLGEKYAEENKIKLTIMPADWEQYGKSAGFIRNKAMAEYAVKADKAYLIAFWNGSSKGTANMINEAHRLNIATLIFNYKEDHVNE